VSLPYVITILVTSGDPDGVRVVEKSNWTGSGMVFSRSDLAAAVAQGLASPGIYVLMGEDPDEAFEGVVYVGEAEDVGKRLASHQKDDSKEFWTDTVVFTSKDAALNKAHIRYVESRLIALAHGARRVRLSNGTQPSLPPMSHADMAEAEGFLAEMLAIFPVLGVSAFDKPVAHAPGRVRYFLSGPDAKGEGEERSDGFLVFAGASCRIEETSSLSPSFSKLRSKLVASGVLDEQGGVYRLTEDHLFKSPSTAAMTLLSRNANGRTEWKDANGVSLKEHQIADATAAGVHDEA
jgi:hypothetical protein